MKKKFDVRVESFNKMGYVEDNAVEEGTFLDCEYGEGMYVKTPVEALAYALIMANKEVLMNETNKPRFKVEMILQKIDDLVDFPENYSKEDFLRDVKKTFAQKKFNPADFMEHLEENICIDNCQTYNHKMIKKAFFKKIEKVLKIDKNTKKESALLQCLSIQTPPEGLSKMDLIDSSIKFIDDLCTRFADNEPQFFEKTDFTNEDWFEDFMLKRKVNILKRKKEDPQEDEKVDAYYQMKAQFISFEDLIELANQDEKYIQDRVLEIENKTSNHFENEQPKSNFDYKQLY